MTNFLVQKLVKARKKMLSYTYKKWTTWLQLEYWNAPAWLGTFIARLGSAREIPAILNPLIALTNNLVWSPPWHKIMSLCYKEFSSPEIISPSFKGGGGVKIRPILLHNRIQSRQMKRYYRGDNDMSLSPSL